MRFFGQCSALLSKYFIIYADREEKEIRFEMKTHGSKREDGPVILVVNSFASRDLHDHVVGVCFVAQDMTVHKLVMDKFTRVEGDYKAIVHNPNPLIPPIFGTDQFGWCSEWNAAMTKLTGWHRDEVIDKMLLGEVFDSNNASCRLKDRDAFVHLCIIINSALAGKEAEKALFGFFDRNGKYVECLLSVNRKENEDGVVTGVFCFIHVPSDELQHSLHVQQASEQTALRKLKAFSYMRHAINKPLSGMVYSIETLKNTGLNEEQMRHLRVADSCHHQLNKILADLDQNNITDKYYSYLIS
jgi:phytochrome A